VTAEARLGAPSAAGAGAGNAALSAADAGGRAAATAAEQRVVAFVGRSGTGKTTLLEGVISSLAQRGLRVGVVKHHAHDIELDVPKKDSWRHAQAGAVATVVSGPRQFALVRRVEAERTLDELVALMPDVDIVLAEGFKAQAGTCVEVLRAAHSTEPVCSADQLSAIVTDVPTDTLPAPLADAIASGAIARFALDDIAGIADAVANGSLASAADATAVPR
jgi:molybdopterin-guanine dinucleotide biosynthesis adapter protein